MKPAMLAVLAAGMLLAPLDGFARPGATVVIGAKPFHGGFAGKRGGFHRPGMHRLGQHRSRLHHFRGGAFRGGQFGRSSHRGGAFFGSRHAFGRHGRHAGFRHAHVQRGFGIPITWLGGTGFYGAYYDPSDYAGIHDPGPAPAGSDAPRAACRSQEVVITDSPDAVVVLRC